MSEHIVKSFTEQLELLANGVAQMGGLAEAQVAVMALVMAAAVMALALMAAREMPAASAMVPVRSEEASAPVRD